MVTKALISAVRHGDMQFDLVGAEVLWSGGVTVQALSSSAEEACLVMRGCSRGLLR